MERHAWGITVRQSDDGLDLLDTIVAEQMRKMNFTVFNVSEAIKQERTRAGDHPPAHLFSTLISTL